MELFSKSSDPIDLKLPDADITYYPAIYDERYADSLFEKLYSNIKWQHDTIKVFGKVHAQPRLTSLYAMNSNSYSYSGITMHPIPFSEEIEQIKNKVEMLTGHTFTTCLLNLYRDGQDSNGWHADNEKSLGPHPIIASVSLGTPRWFHLKHRTDKQLKTKIFLESGSLLLMKGATQEFWLHQLPKTKRIITPRINLTFRTII